jgi:choline transport protein
VFTEFTNSGGWSSTIISLMIGQVSAVYACLSADGITHMGEEVEVSH